MALNATIGLLKTKLPGYVGAKEQDIQVLTPMRNGILGVNSLNEQLQKFINPPSPDKSEKEIAGTIFREGDKVMQVKNNYQLSWEQRSASGRIFDTGSGIFNGDMGVTKINNTNYYRVVFDDDRYVLMIKNRQRNWSWRMPLQYISLRVVNILQLLLPGSADAYDQKSFCIQELQSKDACAL